MCGSPSFHNLIYIYIHCYDAIQFQPWIQTRFSSMSNQPTCDYIVADAGSAGCALAAAHQEFINGS